MAGRVRYANRSGRSGVVFYEVGPGWIQIYFKDGACYLYTIESAGKEIIDKMIELAEAGIGLNSFISRVVRKKYDRKGRYK